MDSITLILASICVIITGFLIYYVSETLSCKKNYKDLEIKYEQDTTPIKIQIADLKTKVFGLENDKKQLEENLSRTEARNVLYKKNIIGKFTDGSLINNAGNCVSIADSTKGDLTFLQVKNTQKCNPIFTYDPSYKQIIVKVGTSTKCVDAFNENDVVLNDCIKNSQKQKFDYFPLYDSKLKSSLYSKCLTYDKESNIIQLKPCNKDENILVKESDKYLYIQNE
jgi:hypothetical protein